MQRKQWLNKSLKVVCLLCWLLVITPYTINAQDEPTPAPARVFITSNDISSPPSIAVNAYALDEAGNALDLTSQALELQHNGTTMIPLELQGNSDVGTLTIFLIDIPTGVEGQFELLQEAILAYSSSRHMQEQVDAVAIYQVGETAATQRLEPTFFYNSVRNFFTQPITPETGATALLDSLGNLINQVDSLKPNAEMAASIVVISDGTDAVSTQFSSNDLSSIAVSAGVPVHTIWLINDELSPFSQEAGRTYLTDLASSSWGVAAPLTDSGQVTTIWNRITQFRSQTQLRYTVADLAGGDANITLNLLNLSATRAQTAISIPANLPSIQLAIPPESRTLSWPDLAQPVSLNFPTTLSWLDGAERAVEAAQLQVNGAVVQDIPVAEIANFAATVSNFTYGTNSIEVVLLDDQGIRVTSPPLFLEVTEGAEAIPDVLQDSSGGNFGRFFFILLLLLLLAGAGYWAWQQGWLARLPNLLPRGPSRPRPQPPVYDPPEPDAYTPTSPSTSRPLAFLEVLEAASGTQSEFSLRGNDIKIGRSPAAADITFEEDLTVSRLHATLMLEGAHYRLYDAQSTSGTWVNEQQVPEYGIQLIDGDEIFIGAVHLRYRQP